MEIFNSNLYGSWHLLTRLGEIQILLPAALLALFAMVRHVQSRTLAVRWLVCLMIGALLTTASKIAFIGWGVGSAEFNFTGISGHAMFSAAIYPLLLGTLLSQLAPRAQMLAVALGFGLALVVGISRIVVGAHSLSEVVAGLLLGSMVSAMALTRAELPRFAMGPTIPVVVALWLLLSPVQTPQLPTHSFVTRLSLVLSGNKLPHTRHDLLQQVRRS
jgi:membrane-associated phospholipid phosphatase